MHVILPLSWFKHPFFVNEFVIDSQEQIDKIIEYGISEVIIVTGNVTSRAETEAADRVRREPTFTFLKT